MFVAPGRAGGVLIEWADDLTEHELEIEPDGSISMLHVNRVDGTMKEEAFYPPVERSVFATGLLPRLASFGAK